MNTEVYKKTIITSVIYIAIFCLIFFFGLKPAISKSQTIKEKIVSNNTKIEANTSKIAAINNITKKQKDFDKMEETINNYLPDNLNSSQFIVEIEGLAKELNFNVDSLSMSEPTTAEKAAAAKTVKTTDKNASSSKSQKNSFTLSGKTEYSSMVEFLSRMEKLSRLNTIDAIDITPEENTLNFKINGYIYYVK